MGHRSIVLLLSVLFAVAAPNVFALGLGKIKLESSLNQPLKAEIELFEVRDLTTDEIRVGVASREDFERIGVDKVYFLSDLKFDVKLTGPGSPKIEVSSAKLVREPFLNFVVEVKWPSGKLLREYTLLVDLPAFSDQTAPAVQPGASRVQPTATTQPRTTTTTTTPRDSSYNPRSEYEGAGARPSSAPVAPSYTGDDYRVQANDTLWEIAASVRPDANVSIHQTMIAIQRVNPDAFINNNINLLKQGRVLRIPDRDEMAQLNRTQAVREVAQQNSQWSGSDASDGAELSSSSSYTSSDASSSTPEGRVKLASPDDAYDSAEGRAAGGGAAVSTDALENELSTTLEQLDKSSRENSDLRSKVASLEEQISTMERMLEVSNESLRAQELVAKKAAEEQAAAAEAVDASETDVSALYPETGGVDEDGVDVDGTDSESIDGGQGLAETGTDTGEISEGNLDPLDSENQASPETTPEPTVAATPLPDKKRVISAPAPPEKGIIDIILDNILYIVGAIVLLAIGAVFMIRKRAADDDEDFDEFLEDQQGGDTVIAPVKDEPDTDDDELDLGDLGDNFDESDTVAFDEADAEPEDSSESEAQTEDVVAEADIYIAYGKYDQAEEMLTRALEKEPHDEDIRLKLLEVYSTQGDGESFDPHYAKLRANASPAVLERADNLRDNIPNIGEFDEAKYGLPTAALLADDDTTQIQYGKSDLADDEDDLSLDIDETFASESTDLLDNSDDELDLDFDLDSSDTDTAKDKDADDYSADFDLEGFDIGDDDDKNDNTLDLESLADDEELDLGDFGDLDLEEDSKSEVEKKASLEADLESLETDLDLSVDFDKPTPDDTVTRGSSSLDDLDDLDDLELPEDGIDFDLEDGLDDLDDDTKPSVSSDTTVNQALNDEYIEQKLSEESDLDLDFDEALPLESEPSAHVAIDNEADDEGDLDLSSLDEELDALTAGLDDDLSSSKGVQEPEVDFEDFDDDLASDDSGKAQKADAADSMFDQAIDDTPQTDDFELPDLDEDESGDDDLDFLSDSDETATKLDLARAYIDMGDQEGARDIIKEVLSEGNDQQKSEAEALMSRIDA